MLREERALWCNNSCTTLSTTTLTCDIENTALDAFASASSTTGSMKLCQVNFFSSMRDNVKHQQIMAKSCILNTYISATDADDILYVFIPVHPMTDVWHWDFSCIWSDLLHPVLLFCRCTCHCSAGISSFYVVCKSIDRLDGSYSGYILTVKHCNELHGHNERGCITARR